MLRDKKDEMMVKMAVLAGGEEEPKFLRNGIERGFFSVDSRLF
jgi:hypothetical protein